MPAVFTYLDWSIFKTKTFKVKLYIEGSLILTDCTFKDPKYVHPLIIIKNNLITSTNVDIL
jgi:hypothetical protein